MRNKKQLAAFMAAVLAANTSAMFAYAGEKTYSIDMTSENDSAWNSVAMANDDTVTSGVNIRSAASEDASVLGYLYRGGAVTVLDKGDTWTEIQSGGITGYIKNEYLVYGTEAKGLAEYYGSYGVRASWDDVNVFSGSDAASSILGKADDGDTFLHIGSSSDGHWIEVQRGADSTAYVSAEDVTSVIMVSSAVAVNADENSGAGAEASYSETTASASSTEDSYTETSYEDTSYTESYSDTSSDFSETYYEDTSYSEVSYEEPSYSDSSYQDYSSADTSYDNSSAASYTYTEVSTDGMSLSEKAQTLYQAYVEAQAAADAAVANGAGEQTIIDTCAAAQSAYASYVAAQNAADEASWGYSSASTDASATTTTTTTTASAAADTTPAAQPETQAPETEAVETEAVETENTNTVSSSDLELLAALIYCEAGNQPYEGQVAVGAVVMNRVASGSFPNTISDVIYQGGQFTPAYSGALASALAGGAGSGYIAAASAAMAGEDPTGGRLYFNTSHGSGVKIGAHWFY